MVLHSPGPLCVYAKKIGCAVPVISVVGIMHSKDMSVTEVKMVIGVCRILASVSTMRSPRLPEK